jgi:uncharacterized membrane protein YfcA
MTITLPVASLIIAGVFGTSVLSGILGMAGGMVLMGLLAWVLPVQQAMILHAVSQFTANGSRAFFHRKHIYRKSLPYYFAGLAIMFALFTMLRLVPDKFVVFILLGAGPFTTFLLPKDMKLDFTKKWHAFTCGVLVTGFQLTGGVSGPMLDMFFQTRHLTRHETVSTKAFTQAVSHITKFIYFGFVASTFSAATEGLPLWLCLAVIPAAISGTSASKFILDKLSDKHFYAATQTALFTIGTVYLFKAAALWIQTHP